MRNNLSSSSLFALLLALSIALFAAACGDSDDGSSNGNTSDTSGNTSDTTTGGTSTGGTTTAQKTEATFVTYNVGLARGFVDYATARTSPVAEYVAGLDADVVCLQEAWLFEDEEGNWSRAAIDELISTAQAKFPHHALFITEPSGGGGGCTEEETAPLEECARENCDGVPDDQLSGCVIGNCSEEFGATSPDCQGCLAANLGKSLDEIVAACSGEGSAYSYNGHNGLLVLSKHPITSSEVREFPSSLVYRAAVRAEVEIPEWGTAQTYCTHLAADLSAIIEYTGDQFESFEEEQAEQIRQLGGWVNATRGTATPVLMGDMNTGPAKGSVNAELPDNYNLLVSESKLVSPYADLDAPECTYCSSNTLVREENTSILLDHILVDPLATVTSAERIGVDTQTIQTEEGDLDLHLSDHFGIRVTVESQSE